MAEIRRMLLRCCDLRFPFSPSWQMMPGLWEEGGCAGARHDFIKPRVLGPLNPIGYPEYHNMPRKRHNRGVEKKAWLKGAIYHQTGLITSRGDIGWDGASGLCSLVYSSQCSCRNQQLCLWPGWVCAERILSFVVFRVFLDEWKELRLQSPVRSKSPSE